MKDFRGDGTDLAVESADINKPDWSAPCQIPALANPTTPKPGLRGPNPRAFGMTQSRVSAIQGSWACLMRTSTRNWPFR